MRGARTELMVFKVDWERGVISVQTRATPGLLALTALGLAVAVTQVGCHDGGTRIFALPTPPSAAVTLDPLASVLAGGSLALNGTNFIDGTTTVTFGSVTNLAYSFTSATQLIVTVPPDSSGTGTATVTVSNGGSNTASQTFTYGTNPATPPVIVSLDPTFGGEGSTTEITVVSRNTDATNAFGNYFVTVGPFPPIGLKTAITDPSNPAQEILTADVPPLDNSLGATNTAYPLTLSFGTLSSGSGFTFTYTDSVVIYTVSPNQGPLSGQVPCTIKGRNFEDPSGNVTVSDIQFGGISVSSFTVLDANTISTTIPDLNAPALGLYTVSVSVIGAPGWGTSTLERGYVGGRVMNPVLQYSPDSTLATTSQLEVGYRGGSFTVNFAATLPGGNVRVGRVSRTPFMSNLTTAATGSTAEDLTWTDFDSNGMPDLAVGLGSGDIFLWSNDGASTVTLTGVGTSITEIAAGDFNRDTLFDLAVVTNNGGNQELTFIPTAGGGTPLPAGPGASVGPYNLGTAPVVELIGCQPEAATRIGFDQLLHPNMIASLPAELRYGADTDANADLIAVHDDGSIHVVTNVTGTTVTSPALGFAGGELAVAAATGELNFDGLVDLVVLTNQSKLYFLQGSASGAYSLVKQLTLPSSMGTITPFDVTMADVDRDCRRDVVVSNLNGEDLLVLRGNANAFGFGDPVAYKVHLQPRLPNSIAHTVATTLDQDILATVTNAPDTSSSGVTLVPRATTLLRPGHYPNVLAGAYSATDASAIATGDDPRAVLLRDIDRDADNDVVIANYASNTLHVRFNTDGKGALGPVNTVSTIFEVTGGTLSGPRALGYGDIDGDGIGDVVIAHGLGAASTNDYVQVMLNTTDRTQGVAALTSAAPVATGGKGPRTVWVGNIDNQNGNDVLVLNGDSNNVSLLLNDGTGTLTLAGLVGTGNSPASMVVVDMGIPEGSAGGTISLPSQTLQGDGLRDLVVANRAEDSVSVIYNGVAAGTYNVANAGQFGLGERLPINGAIAPQPFTVFNNPIWVRGVNPDPPVEPVDVAVADLNQDGELDIVTADRGTGTVTILYANANDRVFSPVDFSNPDRYESGDPVYGGTSTSTNGSLAFGAMPALGTINGLGNGAARKWFLPRDYRMVNPRDTTLIGSPAVVFPTIDSPTAVRVVDIDLNGRPEIVVVSASAQSLVVFDGAGTDTQGGPNGPYGNLYGWFFPHVMPPQDLAGNPLEGEAYFRSPAWFTTSPIPGYSFDDDTYTSWTDSIGGNVVAVDIQQMDQECPPDIAIIREDDTLIILQGE